jgi:hypothetical protein
MLHSKRGTDGGVMLHLHQKPKRRARKQPPAQVQQEFERSLRRYIRAWKGAMVQAIRDNETQKAVPKGK